MQNRPTVLIVDDDPGVLQSLQRLLQLNGYHVETFSSATAMLASKPPTGPCCAIVDLKMPGRSGLELQLLLAQTRPGLPVIFITGYGDIPEAVQAIRAGAADFLTKPIEERKLLDAVKRALALEQRLRRQQQERASYLTRFDTLTPREKQVCALVVEGKLNKQIAAELGTCEKTVKVHRGRVMKKMKVESLAELVRVCMKIRSPGRQEEQPATANVTAKAGDTSPRSLPKGPLDHGPTSHRTRTS
jgi:FixJ family two-component response regulator